MRGVSNHEDAPGRSTKERQLPGTRGLVIKMCGIEPAQERGADADFSSGAPASPVVFFGAGLAAGLALALGFAGFVSALSAAGAGFADSGLALACLVADLPAAGFPSLAPSFSLVSGFASTEASGFFAATRDFLPRRIV